MFDSKVGEPSNVRFRLECSSSSCFRLLEGNGGSKAGMMHICDAISESQKRKGLIAVGAHMVTLTCRYETRT